ncbi:Fibromodulin isoform X2 [Aphelenchoides fujianensis]|nr:Fibromodulin isoform X2 [Aphelenchoides fujianensis]
MRRLDWIFVWILALSIGRKWAANFVAYGGGMMLCPPVPDADACRCQTNASWPAVDCSNKNLNLSQKLVLRGPTDSPLQPKEVDLSGNSMKTFDGELLFDPIDRLRIERLDLSRNGMKGIEVNALDGLLALRSLNLSHNSLGYAFSDSISWLNSTEPCDKLTDLDLSYNKLTKFPTKLSVVAPRLKRLDLSGNSGLMQTFHGYYYASNKEKFTELEELYLEDCGLSGIPSGFLSLFPKLKKLSLVNNPLTRAPDLYQLRELRVLDLSGTNIQTFSSDGKNLEELYLRNAPLEQIQRYSFNQAYQLKILDFENTSLSEIPDTMLPYIGAPLQSVNIRNCRFTSWKAYPRWGVLGQPIEVRIDGNPWHCDNKLEELFVESKFRIVGEGGRCASPPALTGRSLPSIYAWDGTHDYESKLERKIENEVENLDEAWRERWSPRLHRLFGDPRTFFVAGALASAAVLLSVWCGCRLCSCGIAALLRAIQRSIQRFQWQRMCRPTAADEKDKEERVFLIGGGGGDPLGRVRQLGRLLGARARNRWNFDTPRVQQYVQRVNERKDDEQEEEQPVVIDGVEAADGSERNEATNPAADGATGRNETVEVARCRWTPDRPCAVYFESSGESGGEPQLH